MATREKRKETIDRLCDEHECNEKVRKIHFDQFVNRKWQPHPPKSFQSWWAKHPDFIHHEIDARRAYNCHRYQDEFMEAKMFGAT